MGRVKLEKLVRAMARKFPRFLRDDLVQEGWLALVEAERFYDPTIGELWTFARMRVFKAMRELTYSFLRHAEHIDNWEHAVIEAVGYSHGFAFPSSLDMAKDDPEGLHVAKDIVDRLSVRDRLTLRLHLADDLSFREIEEACGLYDTQARDRFRSACGKAQALAEAPPWM